MYEDGENQFDILKEDAFGGIKTTYYDEYDKAFEEFIEKYGILGDKLRTEAELENDKKFRVRTGHFMDELPQYKEISEKYFAEEKKLEEYRNKCKDDAIDLLKEHFYALWD